MKVILLSLVLTLGCDWGDDGGSDRPRQTIEYTGGSPAPIPEPASGLLFAAGLVIVGAAVRRRYVK